MGITNSNKVINQERIDCDGSLRVTLALTAAPDIITNPTDIALVLDRSGSMTGTPLANMKTGAKTFILSFSRRFPLILRAFLRSQPLVVLPLNPINRKRSPQGQMGEVPGSPHRKVLRAYYT